MSLTKKNDLTNKGLKYKNLFEKSPISIWEEDFSAVYKYIDSLRKKGITNFKEFFENNPEQIDKCSKLVKIVDVNLTTIKMYGAKSKEQLLVNLNKLFTPYSQKTFVEQLILIANNEKHYEGECVNKTIAGKTIDVYLQWSVTEEHQNNYSVVFVTMIDITKMKQTERALAASEEKFRTISYSANDAIIMIDSSGNINFWNRAAEVMFGASSSEVLGNKLQDILVPERYKKRFKTVFKKFLHTEKGNEIGETIEMYAKHKKGHEFPIELSVAGLEIKDEWHGLSIIRDISERKRSEEKNRRQREQIKLINKILRHDLANNLAAINSTINNFKRDRNDDILDTVTKYIESSSDLISKMREHEFLLSSTNLNIYEIEKNFKKILENYQTIDYTIKGKCRIFADDSLNSVIDNLIRNAVVHSETDRIDIKISSFGSTCEVKVIDYGKGIPDDIKVHIFDEGFKYGVTGHSGLGLHIVQKSVKNWGGEILVEDNTPKGSIFAIYLRKVN